MKFIVYLYVEGGNRDGESFVCGPFDSVDEATAAAEQLEAHGTSEWLSLYPTIDELVATELAGQ